MNRHSLRRTAVTICAATGYLAAARLDFHLMPAATEWHQHAFNAQNTSFNPRSVPTPWRWKWMWGGLRRLPRNVQPVTGGDYVFVADGENGIRVLNKSNGGVARTLTPGGAINSTPAYDPETGMLYAVSTNGTVYKINPATGATVGTFATGGVISMFSAPCLISGRLFVSAGSRVYAVNTAAMTQAWSYDAGRPVHTPPAWSAVKNAVVAVDRDLFVHCIDNAAGTAKWNPVKPPAYNYESGQTEALWGWPVVAEQHGLVLVKTRIRWSLVLGRRPMPSTNAAIRSRLEANPEEQCLFSVNLDNGTVPFVCNVGHGGYGDGDYLPMGPMPVIKALPEGGEVGYVVMRGSPCLQDPCDARWDSRFGELLLDNTTVSGYSAGHVRWMTNTFFPTDEQAFISMAGDHMFGGHWAFGLAHRITDRSANRGSGSNPIVMSTLPHIMESQRPGQGCTESTSHSCNNLVNCCNDWRATPAGFYIYWNIDAVYDRYWNNHAMWVVSDGLVLYRSNTGAIVALESVSLGKARTASTSETPFKPLTPPPPPVAGAVLSPLEAMDYPGSVVTVEGEVVCALNNGKSLLLGFAYPHAGTFKVQIPRAVWPDFAGMGTALGRNRANVVREGDRIRVRGLVGWYQGDPTIYVSTPDQITMIR